MREQAAVSLRNVSKRFGELQAVNALNLEIHQGEIFGVIGPNGAGKSTCVNMITGMLIPDSGEVRTLGLDPIRQEKDLRKVLGVQFQEATLPEQISVKEALKLYASFYDHPANWQKLAEEWDLTARLGARFGKLSGGQKQRLFICLALINQPKVVVLDELTTGLDPQARRASWELVKRVRENGATVLLVTHFMEEAEYLCDRIALINKGQVQVMGTPDDLTASQPGQRTVTFTAPAGFDITPLRRFGNVAVNNNIVTVQGGEYLMADVAVTLRELGFAPDDLATEKKSLEDLFLALTDEDGTEATR